MNYENLKNAFGSTPEYIKDCVHCSLHEERRSETIMKKKLSVSLALVLALMIALGCTAVYAGQTLGLSDLFTSPQENGEPLVNEEGISHIRELNHTYEGEYVRFELGEGLYDTNTYALNWTLEPLATDEKHERLFVTIREMHVGDKFLDTRHGVMMNDGYFLDGKKEYHSAGFMPRNAGSELTLTFCVFTVPERILVEGNWSIDGDATDTPEKSKEAHDKLNAAIDALWAMGRVPVDHNSIELGEQWKRGMTFDEALLSTGLMELVEQFTVKVDFSNIETVSKARTYSGEEGFTFNGGTLFIEECCLTPLSFQMECEVISEMPVSTENGVLYVLSVSAEGVEQWANSISCRMKDSVQMENGQYLTKATFEADAPYKFPKELSIYAISANEAYAPFASEEVIATIQLTDAAK